MRYLVVIPPGRTTGQARLHDFDSEGSVMVGDEVLVDELLVRVRTATDVASDGYDGTLVCTPDE